MANSCYVGERKCRSLTALLGVMTFLTVIITVLFAMTVMYYRDHRTKFLVTMSPSEFDAEWKCRVCGTHNRVKESLR